MKELRLSKQTFLLLAAIKGSEQLQTDAETATKKFRDDRVLLGELSVDCTSSQDKWGKNGSCTVVIV